MLRNVIKKADTTKVLRDYIKSIRNVGSNLQASRGLSLIRELKRGKTGLGPYPRVSLFESANRIMTDLVILHGVKWLLANNELGFDSYAVEYGHENNNGYDLRAKRGRRTLIGEAFNVSPSFFQGKKAAMIRKLRIDKKATVKLILINHDSVAKNYNPKPPAGMHFVFVDIDTGECTITPKLSAVRCARS
jgi:hypothetical protein